MNQIKVRGQRKDTKEWVYSSSIINERNSVFLKHPDEDKAEHWIEIIPETLGQFIGLKDKSGKQIHEGDVIKLKDREGEEYIFDVAWESSGQCTGFPIGPDDTDIEIIGNVYEQPGLI